MTPITTLSGSRSSGRAVADRSKRYPTIARLTRRSVSAADDGDRVGIILALRESTVSGGSMQRTVDALGWASNSSPPSFSRAGTAYGRIPIAPPPLPHRCSLACRFDPPCTRGPARAASRCARSSAFATSPATPASAVFGALPSVAPDDRDHATREIAWADLDPDGHAFQLPAGDTPAVCDARSFASSSTR